MFPASCDSAKAQIGPPSSANKSGSENEGHQLRAGQQAQDQRRQHPPNGQSTDPTPQGHLPQKLADRFG